MATEFDTGIAFPETLPAQVKDACARGLNTHEIACEVTNRRGECVTEAQVVAVLIEGEAPFVERLPSPAQPIVRKPSRQIIAEVAKAHGLTPEDLTGRKRYLPLVHARCEAMRKVKQERPALSFPQIGRMFNRDHTTVMHHLGKVGGQPWCTCDRERAYANSRPPSPSNNEAAPCVDATL